MQTKFWLESLKGRDHSEDLHIDSKNKLKRMLGKKNGRMRSGFIWLRIGTNGRLS
jgi:hypothetical protein